MTPSDLQPHVASGMPCGSWPFLLVSLTSTNRVAVVAPPTINESGMWYRMCGRMWNAMKKRAKVIQVPIQEELLGKLDEYSRERGQSRAAFIREACARYMTSIRQAESARQYVEGYKRFPEPADDSEWRLRLAAEVWGDEEWDEQDFL